MHNQPIREELTDCKLYNADVVLVTVIYISTWLSNFFNDQHPLISQSQIHRNRERFVFNSLYDQSGIYSIMSYRYRKNQENYFVQDNLVI